MGETPLYQAVDMEQIEHVKLLLKHKADPNLSQTDGLTPLHNAVTKQNVQIVQCLLSANANPNIKSTCFGQTPVHFAIKNNVNPTILLLLVQYNGSLVLKDKTEKRPIDYANSEKMKETLKKLRLQKEDIFRTPKKERSMSFTTPKNITSTFTKQFQTKISSEIGYKNIDIYSNTVTQDAGSAHFNIIDFKNRTNSENRGSIPLGYEHSNSNHQLDMAHLRKDLFNTNEKKNSEENDFGYTSYKKDYHSSCLNSSNQKRGYQNQYYYTTDKKLFKDMRYSPIEEMKDEDHDNDESSKSISIKKKLTNKMVEISNSVNKVIMNKGFNLTESVQMTSNNKDNLSPNDTAINAIYSCNTMREREINFNQETFKKITLKKDTILESKEETQLKLTNNQTIPKSLKGKNEEDSELFPETIKYNTNTDKTLYQKPRISKTSTYSYDFNHVHKKKDELNSHISSKTNNFTENHIQNITNIINSQNNTSSLSNTNPNIVNTTKNNITTTNVDYTSSYNNTNKVDTIYYSTNENNKFTLAGNPSTIQPQNLMSINTIDSSKLYEWLREINLLCYYPLFIEKGIYSLDSIISDMKKEKFKLLYQDIEEIGIKKPGHIYRILVKLEIDSDLINKKIYEYVKNAKNCLNTSTNIKISKEYFCGCNISNEKRIVNEKREIFNLGAWLRNIGMVNLKENFMYNGFDMIEFFIIQMFSSIPIDEHILKDYLHIYSEKQRDLIIMQLNRDVRYIMKRIDPKYSSTEIQKEIEETSCKACIIF